MKITESDIKYIASIEIISVEESSRLGYKLAKNKYKNKKFKIKDIKKIFTNQYFSSIDSEQSGIILEYTMCNGKKLDLVFLESDLKIHFNKKPLNRNIELNSIVFVVNNKNNKNLCKDIPYYVTHITPNSACRKKWLVEITNNYVDFFVTFMSNIKIKDLESKKY